MAHEYIDVGFASPTMIQMVGSWKYHSNLVTDLSKTKVGSLFTFGKYQVESEDPWAIVWEIVHKTDEYQIAQTKQIIDLRCFDAKESTNTDSERKSNGNNNWQYSNIKQFLNSDQATWYSAQHQYDAPPNSANCWQYSNGTTYNAYDTHKGFLYYFSDEEKSLLKDMTFDLANPTVDGGGSYTWTGKVWLPTYTQMSGSLNNNISEGTKFDKYSDDNSRIKTIHENCAKYNEYCKVNSKTEGTAYRYWMSSAYPSYSYNTRYVFSDGYPGRNLYAYYGNDGLAPCICLPLSGSLSDNGGGVIKTISFFIDDVAYKAPNGYTFASWVNSSYNIDGYSINSGKVVNTTKDTHIEDVDIDTTIIDGEKYTTVSGSSPTIDFSSMSLGSTFNFGKYQVESEDPWAIEWEIVHEDSDGLIAQTKQIIDLRCFDAKESTNTDSNRSKYGNNNWQYSNIKQFLNSDQATWYSAQHQYDAPPNSSNCYQYSNGTTYNAYDTHKGFLYYFSDEEKSLLKDMTLTLANNTVTDGGGSYTWTGKVWLPTYTQMSGNQNNSISEGTKFDKYSDDNSRIKTIHENCVANNEYCKINSKTSGTAWYYWMSSAYPSYSYDARFVYSDGYPEYHDRAYNGFNGLAPCICLPKTGGLWVKTNSLTWHLNDNIAETATESKSFPADFTSDNITFKRIDVVVSSTTKKLATIRYYQLLNGTMTELLKSAKDVYIYNITTDGKESIGYYENYRTLVFNELPSGDLLTWLQANATPV